MNKTEYKDGGNIIDFNPNHVPSKRIINYAKSIKQKHPKIWDLGGNIFGNEAFVNLERVSKRGYWLESEEWMYIKWRSYVARHQHDFRINGVIAMLKWADIVNKGWAYMKDLIEAKIEKTTEMKKGGEIKLLAPNGEPTNLTAEQYKLVRTPSFKKWFGDWENDSQNASKVIDENGEPLVVYHGTYVENPFYIFDFNKADLGFHFGTQEQAKKRAETKMFFKGYNSTINHFFLNIKTIYEVSDIGDWEYPQRYLDMFMSDNIISETEFKKNNFQFLNYKEDNQKIRNFLIKKYNDKIGFAYNNKYEGKGKSYIVIEPNQIKLADNTNTTFDGENPDIRFSLGGQIEQYKEQDILEFNFYPTNSKHAKEYGINAKNPLFIQNLTVKEIDSLKNLDEYAKNNGHDVIFGHIIQKAKYPKDKQKSFFSDVEMIKNWLNNNGYSINQDNNDFHKFFPNKMRQGSDIKIKSSNSSRFKPFETINFNPPFVGKNGNKLVSYTWKYDYTIGEKNGEFYDKRVSDWTQAEISADTGKNIVHAFTILKTNGENEVVSSESVPYLLGLLDKEDKKKFSNIANASKTLAQQQMKLSIIESQQKGYEEAKKSIIENGFPSIQLVESRYGLENITLVMGDATTESDADNPYQDERIKNLKEKYIILELKKLGISFNESMMDKEIFDLKKRIELQKRKLNSQIDVNQMKQGGNIDKQDSVTMDIPLLIRTLELAREDVKSDAELHHVVENLLKLKNKKVLTMDDYEYIAKVKNKHIYKMKKGGKITEEEIMNNKAGGVLIGKDRHGQTIIPEDGSMGGFLVGKLHKDGGIQAVNKSNGQPIEMQGNEVVITSPAVADTTKKEFEGKMMTNREILSKINSDGGGVEFAKGGSVSNNSSKVSLATTNKIKNLSKRILEIESLNLGNEDDFYSYKGNLSIKERAKLIKEQIKLENELTEITDKLSQTQCFSIDSEEFQALNTAGDYGYEDEYADGGELKGSVISNWDNVPSIYRNIAKVKKVPFENNPNDKGLLNIMTPFLGKDDLRPIFSCINFDANGITGTEAHILITLPFPNPKFNGIYEVINSKKQKKAPQLTDDEKYINYEAVIRKSNDNEQKYEVSVFKLLQYVKTALNYVNKTTHQICFKYGKDGKIGANGKFLEVTLTALLKLGHEKAYLYIEEPTRALIFSPSSNYTLGKDELILTMPVIIKDDVQVLGAQDIDYEKALKVYYDFSDDSIHNADGSIAEFKFEYENNSKVDVNYINLLSKFTNYRNNVLNILNFAKAKNGLLTATNLETTISVKNVGLENGLYSISNKALQISKKENINDYPIIPLYDSDESYSQKDKWFEKKLYDHDKDENSIKTAFEFEISSDVFNLYIQKLVLSKGDDDLRPVMSGLLIQKTSENEIYMVSTDAHTMCKINLTDVCKFKKDDRELKYIITNTYLKDFSNLTNGLLTIKCNKSYIYIESESLQYIARTIDGAYPNYNGVIPYTTTNELMFNIEDLKNLVKSPKVTQFLTKYKDNKRISFSYLNNGNKLYIKANESNGRATIINDLLELGDINFNSKESENYIPNSMSLFLIMPIMGNEMDGDFNFQFGKTLFERMLNTISQKEVPVYYNKISSSYIVPIDSKDVIFDKPKSIIKKVEVKKEVKAVASKPKKVAETPKVDAEKLELDEAIETLNLLLETLPKEEHKEIKEAIEILEMLK